MDQRELNVKGAMDRAEVLRPLILQFQGRKIPESQLNTVNLGLDICFLADEVKRLTKLIEERLAP